MLIKAIVAILSCSCLVACMSMGIFSAAGACALMFGSGILDTALGDPPDHTHPAFYIFLILVIPGMIIGSIGALFGIILPLHFKLKVPFSRSNDRTNQWLHRFATALADFTKPVRQE